MKAKCVRELSLTQLKTMSDFVSTTINVRNKLLERTYKMCPKCSFAVVLIGELRRVITEADITEEELLSTMMEAYGTVINAEIVHMHGGSPEELFKQVKETEQAIEAAEKFMNRIKKGDDK